LCTIITGNSTRFGVTASIAEFVVVEDAVGRYDVAGWGDSKW